MTPTIDFAYCLTREKYAEQCRQCKRDHTKYEWKEEEKLNVYWMANKQDTRFCANFVFND